MRNISKIGIGCLLFLFSVQLKSQQSSISGIIKGGENTKIILSRVYGGMEFATDSTRLKADGTFSFFIKSPYTGIYRLSFFNQASADIIVNNEEIIISCSADAPESTMNIVKSFENSTYYSFLHAVRALDDSIRILKQQGQILYEKDPVKNKKELQHLASEIKKLNASRTELALSAFNSNPNLFASKIIKTTVIPSYSLYLKTEKNPAFKSEFEFLKYHFLDNIDFSDSSMLNSPVLYEQCGEYIRNFANPPSVDIYKNLIDILMGKVSENAAIKDYIIGILLETFNNPSWEDVYVYVADTYYNSRTCNSAYDSADISERALRIKKLKPGNKAPDFNIISSGGDTITLKTLQSKYTLLFFWASWCEFCEEATPYIKKLYTDFNGKGLEIVSISADTIAKDWKDASLKNGIIWKNTCDLKGFKSTVIKEYNVMRTPCFFIIDKEKNIIAHLYNASALSTIVEQLEW